MKNVDHSYEQALIMHDNVHIHVIMNIIVTPTILSHLASGEQSSESVQNHNKKNLSYAQLFARLTPIFLLK